MRSCVRAGVLLALILPLTAGALAAQQPKKPPKPSQNLITAEQIQANPSFRTAYDVVSALHSAWLVPRRESASADASGSAVPAPPGVYAGVRVYLDGVYLGNPEQLKNVQVSTIASIRHYVGSDAQTMFGMGNSAGVIAVSTHAD